MCQHPGIKNLPELLSRLRLSADGQTGAMLELLVPAIVGGEAKVTGRSNVRFEVCGSRRAGGTV